MLKLELCSPEPESGGANAKKLVVLFLAVAMTTLADGNPSTESDTTAVRLFKG